MVTDKPIKVYQEIQPRSRLNQSDDYDQLINDCKGIPFWIEPTEEHDKQRIECRLERGNSNCCFWDLIGRPIKHNEQKPLFDYQQIQIAALEYFRKIRVKKFRGGGMTYKFLAWPAWAALSSNTFQQKKAFIITGITQELANDHILRLKNLFIEYYPGAIENMEYTQKTLSLNEALFRAYPQANPEAPRGKTDVFYILADEFDFPNRRIQDDLMSVLTPFRPKTDTYIVLNSTTKRLEGLYRTWDDEWSLFLQQLNINTINQRDLLQEEFPAYIQTIKKELKHRYFLLEFDYLWGLGKIYTQAEIDEVKEDRTFAGEFCLKYGGTVGNVFPGIMIDEALQLGEAFKMLPINQYTMHFGAVDPGWGKITPVYIGELDKTNKIFRIIWHKAFDDQSTPEMVAREMHYQSSKIINLKWMIDGSDRGFVNTCKTMFGESDTWEKPDDVDINNSRIIPVNFRSEGEGLLEHTYILIAKNKVAIPKRYERLETSLRTAYAQEWKLDKDETTYDDDLDCLRLMLKRVLFGKKV